MVEEIETLLAKDLARMGKALHQDSAKGRSFRCSRSWPVECGKKKEDSNTDFQDYLEGVIKTWGETWEKEESLDKRRTQQWDGKRGARNN